MSARELVAFLARQLVEDPASVEVDEVQDERERTLRLKVAPADRGRIIGKEGRTAKALRTLLAVVSAREQKMAKLDILD